MKPIDIVIVNWNSKNLLKQCLDSIFIEENLQLLRRVIVIDNNSKDSSLDIIEKQDQFIIVKNPENFGFAKAANQGFLLSAAPYVLLLNPDTRIFPDTLQKCLQFMNQNKNIDILGCQMVDEESRVSLSCARFPTPLRYFFDATGLSMMLPKVFTPAILMSDFDHRTSRYVDQVMGAFMFMPHKIFEETGYFDEQFFVYLEDLDFAKRTADRGGKSFFHAGIQIYHKKMGTTESVKDFRLALNLQSRMRYGEKHFSKAGYYFLVLTTLFIEPVTRIIFLLIKGKLNDIKSTIRGYYILWKRILD